VYLPHKEIPKFQADTLYRLQNNQLIPEFKLKHNLSDNELFVRKNFRLMNIYRSSRFIFAPYYNGSNSNLYIYDVKERKSYNYAVFDGTIRDDRIVIRQFYNNPEMFYYYLRHINPDDREEPNPTLYIGRFKK
jgi:hypothetical protein